MLRPLREMNKDAAASAIGTPLGGLTIIAALNGLELFGHERENIEVFKALRTLGARVVVGVNAIEDGNLVFAHLRELGFETFPVPFGNQWSWMWLKRSPRNLIDKVGQVIRSSRALRYAIQTHRPDFLYLSSTLAFGYFAPALWRSNLPLIYRVTDSPPITSRFNMRMWHAAMRRSLAIVCLSRFVQRQVDEYGGAAVARRTSLIYGAAAHQSSEHLLRKPEQRIVYVGQVSPHKGVAELIDAFSRISEAHSDLLLDIVGGSAAGASSFERQLRRRAADAGLHERVLFHGYQLNPMRFVERALFQVVPTQTQEPLGIVVLEAKRCGIPVVISPNGGLPEMVRHGVDGYVCAGAAPEALATGLKWMLDRVEQLEQLGQAARQDFAARFGERRFTEEWEELFTAVLNRLATAGRRSEVAPAR